MLRSTRQFQASFHAQLYNMIPEDHFLKKINNTVDFTFIYDLVRKSYCEYYGRPANEPELLFRLLFLQFVYNLSDERVIQDTHLNLAYKWFVGLNPEDPLPDPSQLSRFRRHRLGTSRVEEILKDIVQQCIDSGLIKSNTLIVDATHTMASAQKEKPLDVLQKAANRLFRAVVKKHPKLEKKLPPKPEIKSGQEDAEKVMLQYLAELGEAVEQLLPDHEGAISEKLRIAKQIVEDERLLSSKGIMSAIDPDARFGRKSQSKSFFGYKEHIAMTEEEIITAVEVTSGNQDDGKQLRKLIEQSKKNGFECKELIGDKAYSGKDNLAYLKEKQIQPIVSLNPIVHNGCERNKGFEYNKDADVMICPAGEPSIHSRIQKSQTGHSDQLLYFFDVEKCRNCPLREGCYKPGAKTKTYSVRLIKEEYQSHIEFEQTDYFKQRVKRRPIIEHKNAELKRYHGLTKARYHGLFGMRLQAILTAFVVNAKRMVTLKTKVQPTS
jgi:transposase